MEAHRLVDWKAMLWNSMCNFMAQESRMLAMSSASSRKLWRAMANAKHDYLYHVKLECKWPQQYSPSCIHLAENLSNIITPSPNPKNWLNESLHEALDIRKTDQATVKLIINIEHLTCTKWVFPLVCWVWKCVVLVGVNFYITSLHVCWIRPIRFITCQPLNNQTCDSLFSYMQLDQVYYYAIP